MSFKSQLLDLISELLIIFENNNIIYKRLIYIRHQLRNVFEESDLVEKFTEIINRDNIHEKILNRDVRLIKNVPFNTDLYMIWENLSPGNKLVVWAWIDKIVGELEC